ncbi:MAG TPA: DsrE family protein [Pseudomonadales bacterium]|jgi:intracellular sulfur oxidation DsrE/DsrF family protein
MQRSNPIPQAGLLALASLLASLPWADALAEGMNDEKPFAEAHVILQVSDADPSRHQTVLDIANNLTRHYGGPDMADIEIIAFSSGVKILLTTDNPHTQRIANLMENGVRFYVCGNTLDTIERRDGKRPVVLPGVREVQTGVAFMIEEIAKGYVPVHP